MRAPELTTEEFLSSIGQSPDFSTDHQGLVREFLKQADLVKFARAEPSSDETERAIEKAELFLEETRDSAPMLVAGAAGGFTSAPTGPYRRRTRRGACERARGGTPVRRCAKAHPTPLCRTNA